MLTVLIETHNSAEGLARTVAPSVGAAVHGLVREVIVCDRGSVDQTLRVADHVGCHVVTAGIAAAVSQAKGDWLLILEPGARLAEGWIDVVADHIVRHSIAAQFTRARADRLPFLARVLGRQTALSMGLLIAKGQAASLARKASDAEGIARGLATRRLPAEIFAAG